MGKRRTVTIRHTVVPQGVTLVALVATTEQRRLGSGYHYWQDTQPESLLISSESWQMTKNAGQQLQNARIAVAVIFLLVFVVPLLVYGILEGDKEATAFDMSLIVAVPLLVLVFFFLWFCWRRAKIRSVLAELEPLVEGDGYKVEYEADYPPSSCGIASDLEYFRFTDKQYMGVVKPGETSYTQFAIR